MKEAETVGECMFNPPIMGYYHILVSFRTVDDFVRPVVKCTDWCHNCEGKDQTGGTCRHCKYFRVFKSVESED